MVLNFHNLTRKTICICFVRLNFKSKLLTARLYFRYRGAADMPGVERNRQTYDHSRNGPIRDDSNRRMSREANFIIGAKPNHMYSVWKG